MFWWWEKNTEEDLLCNMMLRGHFLVMFIYKKKKKLCQCHASVTELFTSVFKRAIFWFIPLFYNVVSYLISTRKKDHIKYVLFCTDLLYGLYVLMTTESLLYGLKFFFLKMHIEPRTSGQCPAMINFA